jgi:hypothetical protein
MSDADRILQELRKGGIVMAARRAGKTTALLRLAEELGSTTCVVVSTNLRTSRYAKDRWQELFPEASPPTFIPAPAPSDTRLRETTAKLYPRVLLDDFSLCHWLGHFFAATEPASEYFRTAFIGDHGIVSEIKAHSPSSSQWAVIPAGKRSGYTGDILLDEFSRKD